MSPTATSISATGRSLTLAPAVRLPRVLGHEIVGIVEELGHDATGVKVGDRRAVYAWGGCGISRAVPGGRGEFMRQSRETSAFMPTGALATTSWSSIRDSWSNTNRCRRRSRRRFGCSGLTAYSALKKAAPVNSDHPLLIIGAGGLGLAAISLCHALYGMGPIVAEIDAAKRQAALEAGASAVVDPIDPEARKSFLAETGGVVSAIDFVGSDKSAGFGLSALRKGGRLFVVGLFGGSIGIPLATLPLRAVSLMGVFVGTLPEFRELMALAREGKVKPTPIETRTLDTAQQSLDDLRAGRVRGRVVLTA